MKLVSDHAPFPPPLSLARKYWLQFFYFLNVDHFTLSLSQSLAHLFIGFLIK